MQQSFSKHKNFTYLVVGILVVLIVSSCASSRRVAVRELKPMSESKLIKRIEKEAPDFDDYAAKKVTVNLSVNDEKQSFGAQFKIKHNEFMIVTLRKMTVPLGRSFISDDSVSVINYYDKNYVSGSVRDMQHVFNIENIDFDLLQSLFTADVNSILKGDLKEKEFISTIDNQQYKLESLYDRKIAKAIENNDQRKLERYKRRMDESEFINYVLWIDPEFFTIRKVQVNDLVKQSSLSIDYDDFKLLNRKLYPQEIVLNFDNNKQKLHAEISISKSDVNKENNWDFNVPSKYNRFDAASYK